MASANELERRRQAVRDTILLEERTGRENLIKEQSLEKCAYFPCRSYEPKNGADRLQVCSRCKNAYYCSTECQKNDWSFHKPICFPNVTSLKVFRNITKSKTLGLFLQFLAVVELGLTTYSDPQKLNLFGVHMMMMPEQSDANLRPDEALLQMNQTISLEDKQKQYEGTQGRLYIDAVTNVPANTAMDGPRRLFGEMRSYLDRQGKPGDLVVVCFNSFYQSLSISTGIGVMKEVLEDAAVALRDPRQSVAWHCLAGPNVPLTRKNVLNALNDFIGRDKENMLQLRGKMTGRDIEIMQDAVNRGFADKFDIESHVNMQRNRSRRR